MENNASPQPSNTPAPQAPQQPPTAPLPGTTPPQKSGTGLIMAIIVAAVLLIGGGITAIVLTTANNNSSNSSNNTSSQQDDTADNDRLREANAKTATSLSNFSAVCETGSISNAAEFTKPYKTAAFYKADDKRSWSTLSLAYDAAYTTDYDEFEQANVVICASEKADAAVKSQTCEFKSGGEPVSVDYYATKYTVAAYEAKSGKKIKDLGEVNAPATTCPMFVSYNKSDPRITAGPDEDAVDALVASFVAE